MEVEIETTEGNEAYEAFIDFLTSVTVERKAEKKYVVRFSGNLRKYNFKLQIQDLLAYLLYVWKMSQIKMDIEEKTKAKKEGNYVT